MSPIAKCVRALAVVAAALACGATADAAHNECEDINGDLIMVGEGRFETKAGADESYANVYWGGSTDELDLEDDGTIGGANTAATNLNFGAQAHHEDFTGSDCNTVTFSLQLERSDTWSGTGACPGGTIISNTYTYTINSCIGGSDSHWVFAGRAFGGTGLSYKKYWRATLKVGTSSEESGCFYLRNQNDCTLVNYTTETE